MVQNKISHTGDEKNTVLRASGPSKLGLSVGMIFFENIFCHQNDPKKTLKSDLFSFASLAFFSHFFARKMVHFTVCVCA